MRSIRRESFGASVCVIAAVAAIAGCATPSRAVGDERVGAAREAVSVCGGVTLTTDAASPTLVSSVVHATASAACDGAPTEVRFWVTSPGHSWTVARDWSADATFAWDTAGLSNGTATIEADVRPAGSTGAGAGGAAAAAAV